MGVGWIDNIYNNTGSTWFLKSVDSSHNGAIKGGGESFTLDDGRYHGLNAHNQFHADWCGIPWYWEGSHYKAMSADQQQNVQFYTSQVGGTNWIYFLDGMTGDIVGRQQAPKVDFHCNMRFEDSGNYIDIINDDGTTQDVIAFVYNELKQWAQIAAGVFAALLKVKAGGGPTAAFARDLGVRRAKLSSSAFMATDRSGLAIQNWMAFQSRLLRPLGVDQIDEVDYAAHAFTRYIHVVGGPVKQETLDRNALNALASDLEAEIANPPLGADVPGLRAMLVLVREFLQTSSGAPMRGLATQTDR
jgi:hypothetical protein